MAQPTRQREKAGKFYPPAIQRLVSLQKSTGLYLSPDENWAQVTGTAWSTKRYGLTAAPGTIVCRILNDR
jgi:hypothetical protein